MENKDLRCLQIEKEQVSKIILLGKGKNLGTSCREAPFAFSCAVQPSLALWTWLCWVERFWGECFHICPSTPPSISPWGNIPIVTWLQLGHARSCMFRCKKRKFSEYYWVPLSLSLGHLLPSWRIKPQTQPILIYPVHICSWEKQTSWSLIVTSMPAG